ncbi:beta-ketoacyl-ACP synthase [Oricola sp.]|uniref:beta-ketoacyl-ACP synthase n=1 Tax=Oricola sp. TaxID=1979950 RepID=UPI003BAC323C
MQNPNDVVITGIGLLSSLGEGADAHWEAFSGFTKPVIDTDRFAPYTVHPLTEVDWSQQIAKRGDQRQMEAWQRTGTYAAGLALADAGMKDDAALCGSMDMIVSAGGGERDADVDTMILSRADEGAADLELLVNETLTTELRPTLFLAQLSNLLAGNISIVHKVTGSSRTFMGEEGASIAALQTAAARIRAGQSTHALVGGAYNSEHPDMLLGYELGQHLHRDPWSPVWQRGSAEGGGIVTGSGSAFLVLESRAHAEARNARIYASLGVVAADQAGTESAGTIARLNRLADETGLAEADMIVSAASGGDARTADERQFLTEAFPQIPVRGIVTATGHLREALVSFAVAVAALSLYRNQILPALDPTFESEAADAPRKIGVVALGFANSEGIAMLSANEGDKA